MKKGITVSILVVTVVLMFILVTTATVVGTRTIQTASYEEFLSKVQRVSNDVNQYTLKTKSLPTTLEIISKEGLPDGLKAELNKNGDTANNLFVVDMSKLRTESVNIGSGTVEDMDVFIVAENTNNIYYLRGVEYRGDTYYGVQVIDMPEEWEENVTAVVDGVPIPKGFVVSPYGANIEKGIKAENTKMGGLVIYELEEGETAIDTSKETQYDSWTKRNQYVWVPVNRNTFDTTFVRKNYINTTTSILSDVIGTPDKYWEVFPKTENTTDKLQYMTKETLIEVQKMYESVKEYGGFYIARYEAGIDTQRTVLGKASDLPGIKEEEKVYSVMGKIPYTFIPWTWTNTMASDANGAVQVSRSLYPEDATKNTKGVVSTLTYGVQWDRTIQWFIETNAMPLAEVNKTIGSIKYGNYSDHVIAKEDLNDGSQVWDYTTNSNGLYVSKDSTTLTYPKSSGTYWALSTGALKAANINNIYDMAGNMNEWTIEGYSTNSRVRRGGYFNYSGISYPISSRSDGSPHNANYFFSFRPSLYIKK